MSVTSRTSWTLGPNHEARGTFPQDLAPGPFAVSFWMRPTSTDATRRLIFATDRLTIYQEGMRVLLGIKGDSGEELFALRTEQFGLGWSQHIAILGREGDASVVVNGVEDTALPRPLPAPAPGSSWQFGERSERGFCGHITQAAWGTRSASARDVLTSLFSATAPSQLTLFEAPSIGTDGCVPVRTEGTPASRALAFGPGGGAVRLNAQYAPFEAPQEFSVDAWIKPESRGETWQSPVVSLHGPGSGWELRATRKSFEFMVTLGGRHVSCAADHSADGAWIHVTGVWDRQKLMLYANGVRVAIVDAAGAISPAPIPLTLGRNDSFRDSRSFEGLLGEVRIWGRALKPGDVSYVTFMRALKTPDIIGEFVPANEGEPSVVRCLGQNRVPLALSGVAEKVQSVAAPDAPALYSLTSDAPDAPASEADPQKAALARAREQLAAEFEAQRKVLDERVKSLEARVLQSESERDALKRDKAALESQIAAPRAPAAAPPRAPEGSYTFQQLIESVQQQIDAARASLKGTNGPQLGRVSLDLRVVPDGGFFRFPKLVDDDGRPSNTQIASGNMSSVSLEFEDNRAAERKAPETRKMPDVRGYTEVMATRLLAAAGLTLETHFHAVASERDEGRVVRQWPNPDADVPVGTTAFVFVGKLSQV